MPRFAGGNIYTSDIGAVTTPTVGSVTSVDLVVALPAGEDPYLSVIVYNPINKILWLRPYPAATDDIAHGVPVQPGETVKVLDIFSSITNGISGIYDSGAGGNPNVTVI